MFKKTLIAHFFTTINFKQFLKTFLILVNPFSVFYFKDGKYISRVENALLKYLKLEKSKIISFYNARSAIFHGLKLVGIKKGDEVLVQGYTCVSVPNAVIQTGAKPVYVDINPETFNIDSDYIEKNISKKTKVLIVQHTFGNPAYIEKIKDICLKNNILLMEDCAHSLGSEYNSKKTGTFGDFSVFSTGRDKVISSVTGGFLVINNPKFFNKIEDVMFKLNYPSNKIIYKNLFYNISAFNAKIFYDFFGLGKVVIYLSRRFNLITEILTKSEKECNFLELNYKLPNILAKLLLGEINKLDKYNKHRFSLAEIYNKKLINIHKQSVPVNSKNIYFGYAIIHDNVDEILKKAKQEKILLGNHWNGEVIIPVGTNLDKTMYIKGTCPNAESVSHKIITLPNNENIKKSSLERVINLLNNKN